VAIDSLDDLWDAPGEPGWRRISDTRDLPQTAQRFLHTAMREGAPAAHAVRLNMHGEIKLKGWCPFRAEQVIHRDRGMIWSARVRMNGLPVSGYDRLLDGEGHMLWKLLGLFNVARESGPDVSRSIAGRLAGELVWLPSAFLGADVRWSEGEENEVLATLPIQGFEQTLRLRLRPNGHLRNVSLMRWGRPDEGEHREIPFGAVAEEVCTFRHFTIPNRMRAGWYFDTPRFESEGEFFRGTVDSAEYR
jgi:hypothetical protein